MDANFWTVVGTGATIIGLTYSFLRDFRADMDMRFEKMDKKFDKKFAEMDQRVMETNKCMDGVYRILLKRVEQNPS